MATFLPDTRSSPASKTSMPALTGLRFVAAFNVVLYHFAHPKLPAWALPLENVIGFGYTSVGLFFLLSGFILSYGYLTPPGHLRGSAHDFYISRLGRIYPAYLLAFLLAAPSDILTSLHVNHVGTAMAKLLTNAFVVLTMQQAWTPWTAWAWNYPAWSVSVEVFFYLLFPWLGPRLARLHGKFALGAAFALWLGALAAPAILYAVRGTTGAPQLGDHMQMAVEFTPVLRLPEFAIGILLGRAYTSGSFDALRGRLLSLMAAGLILGVMAFCPRIPHPLMAGGLMVPLFALLIISLAPGQGLLARVLGSPLLVIGGEASYSMYILQIPASFALGMPPPITSPVRLALFCLVLVAVALLCYFFVETPLRLRIKSRFCSGGKGSALMPKVLS